MLEPFYKTVLTASSIVSKLVSRTEVSGVENLPESGPVLIVTNHVSNIDPIIMGSSIGRKRFIRALAKDSLFNKPIMGSAMRKMGHIPVARNTDNANKALAVAVDRVTDGEIALIYPEGTINHNLSEVGKFKTGAARLALLTGATIIPVSQWGAQDVMLKGKPLSLFKSVLTRPRTRIIVGSAIKSSLITGTPITPSILEHSDVVELTKEFQEIIESMVSELRKDMSY